jgi:hypothetical protein
VCKFQVYMSSERTKNQRMSVPFLSSDKKQEKHNVKWRLNVFVYNQKTCNEIVIILFSGKWAHNYKMLGLEQVYRK